MKKYLYIFLLLLVVSTLLYAAETKDVAIILKYRGDVKIGMDEPVKWQDAQKAMRLNSGNIIRTRDDGYAAIMFSDDKSLLKVRENSLVAIGGIRDKASITKRLRCNLGEIWVKVAKQQSAFEVETPSGMATVKGTEFYEIVERNSRSIIICIEGSILFANKLGDVLVKAGETGEATPDSAPKKHKTQSDEIPTWARDGGDTGKLEFEFEDVDGKKKLIKIDYDNN
ncbi:FecR domain-containing protein [candidate division KSB1 bacterium]|nr:FecR domain-containing protein [candidate division KSB1 bacterium]